MKTVFAIISIGVWILAGAGAMSRPDVEACERPGPIRLLSGWAHLGEYTTDGWVGAYHDSSSGAFVTYAFHRSEWAPVLSEKGDSVTDGRVGGRRYREWNGQDARGRYAKLYRELRKPLAFLDDENDRWMDEVLPPHGTSIVIIAIAHEGGPTWVFNAAVKEPKQRHRMEELLLSGDPFEGDQRSSCVASGPTLVQLSAVESLALGDRLEAVLKSLGAPNRALRRDDNGVTIQYSLLENERHLTRVRLVFSQSHQLRERIF